jgi:hypothetical protein
MSGQQPVQLHRYAHSPEHNCIWHARLWLSICREVSAQGLLMWPLTCDKAALWLLRLCAVWLHRALQHGSMSVRLCAVWGTVRLNLATAVTIYGVQKHLDPVVEQGTRDVFTMRACCRGSFAFLSCFFNAWSSVRSTEPHHTAPLCCVVRYVLKSAKNIYSLKSRTKKLSLA